MRKVLAKNPQVEQQKLHRRVFLENIDPENQALMVRFFFFFVLGLLNGKVLHTILLKISFNVMLQNV